MTYNMTDFETAYNLYDVFRITNSLSDNLLVNGGLLVVWVVLFFALNARNPAPESFLAASGALTIISLIFLAMELTSLVWVIGFMLMFAMSAVGAYLRNKTT